jgi:acetyl-CoA carboxylase biotin carboxyl carrier protein
MKTEDIRILAEIMNEAGLSLIEITEKETTIRLEKNAIPAPFAINPQTAASQTSRESENLAESFVREEGCFTVTSPMVGVFFESDSPGSVPYVKVGNRVKKGDVLCIIEAMKIMNEITAERDGEVIDICAENGQLVEYGQCLFRMKE